MLCWVWSIFIPYFITNADYMGLQKEGYFLNAFLFRQPSQQRVHISILAIIGQDSNQGIRSDELHLNHYCDVIMGAIASQITSLTIVYSAVYSDVYQRKHQSSASLAFVWGIHRWIPRKNGQLRGKCFNLMTSSCANGYGIRSTVVIGWTNIYLRCENRSLFDRRKHYSRNSSNHPGIGTFSGLFRSELTGIFVKC